MIMKLTQEIREQTETNALKPFLLLQNKLECWSDQTMFIQSYLHQVVLWLHRQALNPEVKGLNPTKGTGLEKMQQLNFALALLKNALAYFYGTCTTKEKSYNILNC